MKFQFYCKSEKDYGYLHEDIKTYIGDSGARFNSILKFFYYE